MRAYVQVREPGLRGMEPRPRKIRFDPDPSDNAGNRFGLSFEPDSRRWGGDLAQLRGPMQPHLRGFTASFSSADQEPHPPDLLAAVEAALAPLLDPAGAGADLRVAISLVSLSADGASALLASSRWWGPLAAAEELFWLHRGDAGWTIQSRMTLSLS